MSKIRNSLGVLVLPVPNGRISLDEYKKRYGIDLNSIFYDVYDSEEDTHKPCFKDITKIFALSITDELKPYVNGDLPSVIIPNEIASYTGVLTLKGSYPSLELTLSFSIDWIDDHYEVTGEYA